MASVRGGGSSVPWKESILNQIQRRNRTQCACFQHLIRIHNKIFENWNSLRNENIQLNIQFEKLRMETSMGHGAGNVAIAALEKKLLEQQEELTELHKKRGENAQLLVDLNEKLQNKEALLLQRDERIANLVATEALMKQEIENYKDRHIKMEERFQLLKDEHQALQLATTHLEEKLRKVQAENLEMVDRIMKYKSKDAEKMNEENENFIRKRNAKVLKELEDAARDMKCNPSENCFPDLGAIGFPGISAVSTIPSKPVIMFEAHESEVNTVQWSPTEKVLATGGTDRKIKLWDISKGKAESRGTLVGSNSSIMSATYDSNGSFMLGSSGDFAVRVWSVSDLRLRHTFTGHSNKVLAARFFPDESRVVSGSHDRTIKCWDLNSKACTVTLFAMSSCNDLVISDSSGKTIISGHFDKTIKLWDIRRGSTSGQSVNPASSIELSGKVTSLDLSSDGKTLLACVRDDTLRLIDLRMNQVIKTFSSDGFVVSCDWARAAFSADSEYIGAGSIDGSIYIWSVAEGKLEATLKEHKSSVIAVAWHSYMNNLASVDKNKKAIVWG